MKKYLVLALLCLVSVSALANTKITQMPSGGSAVTGDTLPIIRGGSNFKATFPATGAAPNGSSGYFQTYGTSTTLIGLPPASALNAISSGIFVDPRDTQFGLNTCTGYYPITASVLISGGAGWAVNDTFNVAEAYHGTNVATGRVTGVSSGVVTSYTLISGGGGYNQVVGNTLATTATSGSGSGLTIQVSTAGTSGNDDSVAFQNAAAYAVARGGALLVPNGCWISTMLAPSGLTMMGMGFAPSYAFTENDSGSTKPIVFTIGSPNYVINLNGGYDQYFAGFEIMAFTGGGPFVCMGSASTSGGPGFNGGSTWIDHMSFKGCDIGVGSKSGDTGLLQLKVYSSDFTPGFNSIQSGASGNFSDSIFINNTFAGNGGATGIRCVSGCYGGMRIEGNRFEYQNRGIVINDAGGNQILNNQFDHHGNCQIQITSSAVNNIVTGNSFRGGGLAGTLYVTGAANNGSGLIRLTINSDFPSLGGGTATGGVSTGDVADVTGLVGTTEGNGTWTITKIDGTHIDLQGTTFTNAWVSGGLAAIRGKSADICMQSTVASFGQTFVNNNFTNSQMTNPGYPSPAYALEVTTTGSSNDYLMFTGGNAYPQSPLSSTITGVQSANGYAVKFDHFINGRPPHYTLQNVQGTSAYINNADNNGFAVIGGVPTVTSGAGQCGTAASIIGTNGSFRITVGSSTNGGNCPIAFSQPWPHRPTCNCQDETTGGISVQSLSVTTTSFVPSAYALGVTTTYGAADLVGCTCGGH